MYNTYECFNRMNILNTLIIKNIQDKLPALCTK